MKKTYCDKCKKEAKEWVSYVNGTDLCISCRDEFDIRESKILQAKAKEAEELRKEFGLEL